MKKREGTELHTVMCHLMGKCLRNVPLSGFVIMQINTPDGAGQSPEVASGPTKRHGKHGIYGLLIAYTECCFRVNFLFNK